MVVDGYVTNITVDVQQGEHPTTWIDFQLSKSVPFKDGIFRVSMKSEKFPAMYAMLLSCALHGLRVRVAAADPPDEAPVVGEVLFINAVFQEPA